MCVHMWKVSWDQGLSQEARRNNSHFHSQRGRGRYFWWLYEGISISRCTNFIHVGRGSERSSPVLFPQRFAACKEWSKRSMLFRDRISSHRTDKSYFWIETKNVWRRDYNSTGAVQIEIMKSFESTSRSDRQRVLTASSTSSSTSSSSLLLSLESSALSYSSTNWFPSSNRVRCNFFHKIGMPGRMLATNCRHSVLRNRIASVTERSVRDLRNVPRFNVPLQYDNDIEEESVKGQQTPNQKKREPRFSSTVKKRVDFDISVTVVP